MIYVALTVAAFVTVTLLTSRILEDNMLNMQVSERIQQVNDFSVNAAGYFSAKNVNALYELSLKTGRELSGRVLVLDASGVVQVDNFGTMNGTKLELREVAEVLLGERDTAFGYHRISGDTGQFWTAYYASAMVENSRTIGAVVFSKSIQDVINKIDAIKNQYYLIFVLTTLVIIALSYVFTNHISKPLEELRESAMEVGSGKFDKRVSVKGGNEISELGRAFNYMTDRLENIDKQRSEFVSNASHELKTPMTSMKILIESLLYQDGVSEEVYKDFLGDINGEIDRLTLLINDLLLMTKIEAERDNVKMQVTSLTDLVAKTVSFLKPIAAKKDIVLQLHMPDEAFIDCEPVRLRQAVNNLVDNAVKYTQKGGKVDVTVSTEGGYAVVTVEDTGEGMASEELSHIFERFYRVDKARSRETGGTGLGLHIVQRIALLHKGRIEVESEKGVGSVFRLIVPRKQKHDEGGEES